MMLELKRNPNFAMSGFQFICGKSFLKNKSENKKMSDPNQALKTSTSSKRYSFTISKKNAKTNLSTMDPIKPIQSVYATIEF